MIALTVTKKGTTTFTVPKVILFDPNKMLGTTALGSGTTFEYLDSGKGNFQAGSGLAPEKFEVSESFAAVTAAAGATSAGLKKSALLRFDASIAANQTVGAKDLVDAATGAAFQLPVGSVITKAWYRVMTTFTSAGSDAGTISIGIPVDDVAGIKAAIAISDGTNPWDAGNKATIQDGALANYSEITTAARAIQATVATQALTAGEFILEIEYNVFTT